MEEMRKCKRCGELKPQSEFSTFRGKTSGICKCCVREKKTETRKAKLEKLKQMSDENIQSVRMLRIQDFTARELMVELKRRGYEFTMQYVETHIIKSENL